MKQTLRLALGFILSSSTSQAFAADQFIVVPFESIVFEGQPMSRLETNLNWDRSCLFDPYVVLDCDGEAYVNVARESDPRDFQPRDSVLLAVRVPDGAAVSGRLFIPNAWDTAFECRHFSILTQLADPSSKDKFFWIMERHYQRLLDLDSPGAIWFRHQVAAAHQARSVSSVNPPRNGQPLNTRRSGFDDTFDLFTGERALAENLDLDHGLRGVMDDGPSADIATISGITMRAMDWKPLVATLKPELDPLARLIPIDQPGLFFPSFEALARTIDEFDSASTPLLAYFKVSSDDQRTKERYQEQLCLPLSGLSRLLGPSVISAIAVTSSDPFLPSGTDLAVLFECKQPALLEQFVALQHRAAISKGAKLIDGSLGPLKFSCAISDDRRISSYIAKVDGAIVVTNSLGQLSHVVAASEDRTATLASADEYVWFRDRYRRGAPNETAFLVLTDATIRSWVSPRVRIAESRRVRAAAAMAEMQARNLDALVDGSIMVGSPAAASDLPFSSDFVWNKRGVQSLIWGSLNFLTPIAELSVEQATPSEKLAYEAFRRGFESRWRNVFDPIALRLTLTDGKFGLDLTAMPLVVNSDYREWIDWTRNSTLRATDGDIHDGALFQFAMSSDSQIPGNQWRGDGLAIYADCDQFWEKMLASGDPKSFVLENFHRMPLALQIEGGDSRMAEDLVWGLPKEKRSWHGREYGVLDSGRDFIFDPLFCVDLPKSLVVSFREDMVQRAIDRQKALASGMVEPASKQGWLGSSVGVRLEPDGLAVLAHLATDYQEVPQSTSKWSALPILNEWKRRFPAEDPVALHERLWGVRLMPPAGGRFAWNDKLQAMETSNYGSPSLPKNGPRRTSALINFAHAQFGLSFEGEGLRARVDLDRAK